MLVRASTNSANSGLNGQAAAYGQAVAKLLDQRRAIRLLEAEGWSRSTGGKHSVKMTKASSRPITLPAHHGECYSKGLSAAIIRQAGLNSMEDTRCASRFSSVKKERDIGPRYPSSRDASRQAER
jgi:predicted RNA binding protein YcfA (HicA-like mRNA interferase family)